jgi:hypothetical protein
VRLGRSEPAAPESPDGATVPIAWPAGASNLGDGSAPAADQPDGPTVPIVRPAAADGDETLPERRNTRGRQQARSGDETTRAQNVRSVDSSREMRQA